jgi:hypothetical protein
MFHQIVICLIYKLLLNYAMVSYSIWNTLNMYKQLFSMTYDIRRIPAFVVLHASNHRGGDNSKVD